MKAGIDYIGVGCGAIIVNDKNEVLLVKRSLNTYVHPGEWSRPGGKVMFGERIEEAVKREVMEEVGVEIEVLKLLEVTQTINNGQHWIAFGYLGKYISGAPQNLEPRSHDEVKWFPINELPPNLAEYTRNSINVYLNSKK